MHQNTMIYILNDHDTMSDTELYGFFKYHSRGLGVLKYYHDITAYWCVGSHPQYAIVELRLRNYIAQLDLLKRNNLEVQL